MLVLTKDTAILVSLRLTGLKRRSDFVLNQDGYSFLRVIKLVEHDEVGFPVKI
jgi:hypothetical protein